MNKENEWFPESGASNHVTHNLANPGISSEYLGDNKVFVGNDAGLDVLNIDSSFFKSSSTSPSKPIFQLDNMLRVPNITKNLISVSQFFKDNNVYFEFHPFTYFVKEPNGQILLRCKLKDGLYNFILEKAHSP